MKQKNPKNKIKDWKKEIILNENFFAYTCVVFHHFEVDVQYSKALVGKFYQFLILSLGIKMKFKILNSNDFELKNSQPWS